MKAFDDLTQRGQAARLRHLALNALPQWGLKVRDLRLLTNHFNTLYVLRTQDGRRAVVRVSKPGWRVEHGGWRGGIELELAWLHALSQHTKLPVPTPWAMPDGRLWTFAEAPGVPTPRAVAIFDWVPGKSLADRPADRHFETLGEVFAQLHAHGADYQPPARCGRLPKVDRSLPAPHEADRPDLDHLWTDGRIQRFEGFLAIARGTLEQVAKREPEQVCHADLHPYNVLVDRRAVLTPIDFDDCELNHPSFDLGISLYYARCIFKEPGRFQATLDAMRRGYERHRAWPIRPGELNGLVISRQLGLLRMLADDADPHLRKMAAEYIPRVDTRVQQWLGEPV